MPSAAKDGVGGARMRKAQWGRQGSARPDSPGKADASRGRERARFHELVSAGRTGRPSLGFRGEDPDAVRPFES